MTNPYVFTILLYLFFAILGAVDASLTSYELVPWVNGLRWLRVHLVTLGIVTQVIFAATPALVAVRNGHPRPKFRGDIWATLNVGVMALLYGIPLINNPIILAGGTLVFIATALLMIQLYSLSRQGKTPSDGGSGSGKFYIMGLFYLMVGIIIGTGLWRGWPAALLISTPVETHIHANNWGFMSLVFAGLIVDTYPRFAGRSLAWPWSNTPIFWLMSVGALGLTLGPWFGKLYFTVPGLLLHLTATIWLLINVVKPLLGDRTVWTPGVWHLLLAYVWILAPILTAPVVILGMPGFDGAVVEANAPQALIYGWVLQVAFAFTPYFFQRVYAPDQPARLGGNWFSVIMVNLGAIALWMSIFIAPAYGQLHATAYALWALALIPIAVQSWRIAQEGMAGVEEATRTRSSI